MKPMKPMKSQPKKTISKEQKNKQTLKKLIREVKILDKEIWQKTQKRTKKNKQIYQLESATRPFKKDDLVIIKHYVVSDDNRKHTLAILGKKAKVIGYLQEYPKNPRKLIVSLITKDLSFHVVTVYENWIKKIK